MVNKGHKYWTALTVLDSESEGFFRLLKSAKLHHWPLRPFFFPIPEDKVTRTAKSEYFLARKHLYIASALSTLRAEGYGKFIFVDASDTAFIRSSVGLEPFLMGLNFGAEKNCYPCKEYEMLCDPSLPFPYLNSGVIWGEISVYLDSYPKIEGHDQLQWYRAGVGREFAIDAHAEVAVNLHSTNPDDWLRHEKEWIYRPTETKPYIIHANGNWPMPQWAGEV